MILPLNTKTKRSHPAIALASALILLVSIVVGCGAEAESDTLLNTSEDSLKVGTGMAVELPVVTQSPDEIRYEMAAFEPFSPDFEDSRIKLLVAYEKIRKQVGVEGFQESVAPQSSSPSAYVDPETGRLAWRALCCFSPECEAKGKGGGPLLFVQAFDHVKIGPNGKLLLEKPKPTTDIQSPPCPGCGRLGFIRAYDPPETELRRRKLVQELQRTNAAYGAAARSRRSMPKSVRPPNEIMKELAELPKIFLVPDVD